jgi:ribose transport system substrate-binding protein
MHHRHRIASVVALGLAAAGIVPAVVSASAPPADDTAAGDTRLRPDEEAGFVGVLSADQSQTGREVDFGVFADQSIGIVAVLPVPEVTIQTEPCTATIEANGGTAEFVDAGGDPNVAVSTIESWLAAGRSAIWNVSNAGEAVRPAIDQANEAGIPFIGTYAGNEVGSIDIREDEWATVPTIAQYIGNALGGSGKVAVLGSNSIYTLLQRTTILESVLAFEFPDIEVIRWEDFDFTPGGAGAIATAGLQADPEIGAIFAHWDVPATGAIQAVDELGRDDVIITSFTGDNVTGYDFLAEGLIDATVGQSNAQIGMIACEYIALALAGEALPEDTLVPTGFVTAANLPGDGGVFNGRPYVLNPAVFPAS